MRVETGEIGRQAAGAVMVTCGETVVYCTACAESDPDPDQEGGSEDDLDGGRGAPLMVSYSERFSAAGFTAGGFLKRDGRPKEGEVLTSRLVDRPIRPMMPSAWLRETQVTSWLLSFDGANRPEPLAITAAGAALAVSDVPFPAPVAGVRVARVLASRATSAGPPLGEGAANASPDPSSGGEAFVAVINPTAWQLEGASLDLVVAGSEGGVLMVEGAADFATNEETLEALALAHDAIRGMCHQLAQWAAQPGVGKPKRALSFSATQVQEQEDAFRLVREAPGAWDAASDALRIASKQQRADALSKLRNDLRHELASGSDPAVQPDRLGGAFKKLTSDVMRRLATREGVRMDGRGPGDVRPIASRCGVLPRAHGSALFTRGETQALVVATLGDGDAAQRVDSVQQRAASEAFKSASASPDNEEGGGTSPAPPPDAKRFYLQYFFPPSSVGEVGRVGAPGRRELGHGDLAERALAAAMPSPEAWPYVTRVESTITESNGSSSMASVCGGCLALRDAGIPLKCDVAGVAMGLVLEGKGEGGEGGKRHVILSDILGNEDALGDMDFKVAGSAGGISALQMDIKVEGITIDVMADALAQAQEARVHILGEMGKCVPEPRGAVATHAPHISRISIDPDMVGMVIGAGGKTVKQIQADFGLSAVSCNVEGQPEGTVEIVGRSAEGVAGAAKHILAMCRVVAVGEVLEAVPVVEILPFGCLVEYAPKKQALLHISELAIGRVETVEDVVKVGDTIDVKVLEASEKKVRVSLRHLLPDFDPATMVQKREGGGNGQGRRRPRRRDD